MMLAGGTDVDEDRVVLGGPPPPRLRAVVVAPDDLVEERFATEDLVEQQLAVVSLAVIDVEVERPVPRQQPPGHLQPRCQEREVIGKGIVVAQRLQKSCPVAPAREPDPVTAAVGLDSQRPACLRPSRVERGIE